MKSYFLRLPILCAWLGASAAQGATSGMVVTWGRNSSGQTTVPIAAQSGVTALAAGRYHTVALKADGSVVAWGANDFGQSTVPVTAQSGVVAIAAGGAHTVALKTDGSVVAWGADGDGQATVPVVAQSGVIAIAAGGDHTVALKNDGGVVAWGYNTYGQTTVPVAAQNGVMAIAAGGNHTVALKTNGTVVAWGWNVFDQTTVPVAAQSGVTAIATGASHTLALKTDGSVVAWGNNSSGQTTVPVAALSGVMAIAAGERHSAALRTDGSVVSWGYNGNGQMTVPAIAQIGVTVIAAGGDFTVAFVTPTAPTITAQPLSLTVDAGKSANFTVVATGIYSSYQWRKDGTDLGGATNATYSLTDVQTNQAGSYTVVVSNIVGSVTSAPPAVLTVNVAAPSATIILEGGHTPTTVGSSLTLCSSLSGVPLPTRQWQFNGTNLPAQTNLCLYLSNLQTNQSGGYTIVASNIAGVVTSAVAEITILEPVPVLAYFSSLLPFLVGDYRNLSAEVSLPEPATLQWRFHGTNLVDATNLVLFLSPVQLGDAGEYSVVATTISGVYTSPPIVLTVYYVPPSSAIVHGSPSALVGEDVSLWASFAGSPAFVQWRFNGTNLAGETNRTLALLAVTTNQAGQYSFTATSPAGSTTSSVVTITVNYQPPIFSAHPASQSVVEGTTARFNAYAPAGPPPVYFLELNGTNVAVPFTYEGCCGANSGGFSLFDTTVADAGHYRIIASNSLGVATSTVATLTVTPAGPLDRWTQRNPLPQSQPLFAVAHGTNQFVAVGDRGTILTSPDGSNWALQNRRADVSLNGVAYGGGLFVAVGEGGTILSSSDGTNWSYRYTAPYPAPSTPLLNSVTYGAGRFVAVGSAPGLGLSTLILHSSDGAHWERISLNGFYAQQCVAYGDGRFIAAGASSIMVSTDGLNWGFVQSVSKQIESVTYGAGQYVAVGDDGSILISADGASWEARTPLTPRRLLGVTYGAGRFVAAGARGTMLTSIDTVRWTAVPSGTPDRLETIDFSGGLFVSAGENGTLITSTNGTTWTKQNLGITRDLDGMEIANGVLVVVGKGGSILTSTDGVEYTTQNAVVTNDLHGVTWGGGLWIAVGEPGIILTSSNAVDWISRATGTTNSLKDATYANGQWIVVGTQGTIVRSTDGVNWAATVTNPAYDLNDVAYGNGLFLVAGDGVNNVNGSLFKSLDGVAWAQVITSNFSLGKNLRGVTFANGLFLIAANDGAVVTTRNALSFNISFPFGVYRYGENLRAANWAHGLWSVVGNNGAITTSPDLVTWTRRASRTFENQHKVVLLDGKLVVIGNRGTILQSGRFVTELEPPEFVAGGGFRLPFRGVLNRTYQVQESTNLVNWIELLTFTNRVEHSEITDMNALPPPPRFYRLVEQPDDF